jgi:two-component system sensor histidine kinase VicK
LYIVREEKTLQVSGVPAHSRGDGAILVVADVTQRERTERAQREFVTNAAHELRTPVAAIVTSIEMLQTGAKEDPERRDEFLGYIERESNRLTRLTRALLVLARAEARQELPRSEQVSLGPVLERVAGDLEPAAPVHVAVDCDPDLTVATDPELLEQALQSVAQNAARYTTRGTIIIRGRQIDPAHVAVQVIDTGTGIRGTQRERLFDRFYRGSGRNGGFGLGLAIAAQSVRAVGGTIEIRSNEEAGTTVELVLPAGSGAE